MSSHSSVTKAAIGPVGRVEEGQAGGAPRGQCRDDAAEESLHPLVHEARLAHARAPMQSEEIVEAGVDAGRRALA